MSVEKCPCNRITHTSLANVDVEFNVVDYSESSFYSDIMKVTNYRADTDLAKVVANESAETFEWLTDHGIDWEY